MGCFGVSLLWRELLWGVFFFLNSCKQKERDIHNIYLYTETHTEYFQWAHTFLYRETQSKCLHSLTLTHTHTLTYSIQVQMWWGLMLTGVCMLPDDEIPDLCYSWEDGRERQFWSTLEWHSHVNTAYLRLLDSSEVSKHDLTTTERYQNNAAS